MKSGLGSALAAVLLSVAFVASGADDTPAAAPTATAPATPPAAIPALEIPGRAERATAELYRQRAALRPDPAVDRVVADLPAMRASLEQLSSETWLDGLTSRELEDVARQWRRSDDRLADWARIVTRRNQVVEDGMARVRSLEDVWAATQQAAEREALPAVVMEQIAGIRRILNDVRLSLQGQRDTLLATASQIGALQTMVVDRLSQAEAAAARLRHELLSGDVPPIWTTLRTEDSAEARSLAWQRLGGQLADFARYARDRLVLYLLAVVLLLALAIGIRGRLAPPADRPPVPCSRCRSHRARRASPRRRAGAVGGRRDRLRAHAGRLAGVRAWSARSWRTTFSRASSCRAACRA